MKKRKHLVSLTLVTLLAPTLLNAQYVFAEEAQPVTAEQQEMDSEKEQPETEKEAESEKPTEATPEAPTEEAKPENKPGQDSSKEEAKEEENTTDVPKNERANTQITVVVSLIDETPGGITQSLSFTGEAGTTQNVQLPLAPGEYEFISTSDGMAVPIADATGQLGLQLTFPNSTTDTHYISVSVKRLAGIIGGNVYVTHIDDVGNELTQAITVLGGFVGESYTTEPKVIPGYTLISTPVNHAGTFLDTEQSVVYRYDRVQTTVSIVCVDENGTPLGDVVSHVGKFKDTFTITAPEILGYEYMGISQSTYSTSPSTTFKGTYGLEDQNFVATYKKIVDVPTTPGDPKPDIQKTTIPDLLPTTVKTELVKKDLVKKEYKNLPNTGEAETNSLIATLGLTIIAAVYFTKKKREDQFNL